MKTPKIFGTVALFGFLCLVISSNSAQITTDLKIIPFAEWSAKYHKPSQPKPPEQQTAFPKAQYREQDEVQHITFHYCWKDAKSESLDDEITAIGDGVWKANIEKDMKHVAYHYIIGNSGRIYKGRPDTIAPASNTFYFPKSFYLPVGNYARFDLSNPADKEEWKKFRGMVRPLQKESKNTKAFAEIESNAFKEWKTVKGRIPKTSEEAATAIAPGFSQGHITIGFLVKDNTPTEAAYTSAAKLCAQLLDANNLQTSAVRVHREVSTKTDCPGPEVYKWIRGEYDISNHTRMGPGIGLIERFRDPRRTP